MTRMVNITDNMASTFCHSKKGIMTLLVCIDRDGTINSDDKYYLGSADGWERKIRILPGVVEGLRKLKKAGALIYIISNQSGVAMKSLPLLTEKRAREVCEFMMKILEERGAKIDGYKICIHVSKDYADKHSEIEFDAALVKACDCRKPATGMIREILKERKIGNARIYVIGDRVSDVEAALNAHGTGILIPSEGVPGEDEKVKALENRSALVMKSMEEAADFILKEQ
ncbi:MAG: HAD-IIIA family hydrolase [Candidatus Aenigmarchaeota archaeon]|nr:HAD-IIIA family hydrolase [Candidatus Aenigmarchaeota archaeon]